MSNFWKRTITGIIYAFVVLASIYVQCHMQWHVMTALFAIVNAIGLYEFYRITNRSERIKVPTTFLIISGTLLYFACVLTMNEGFASVKTGKFILYTYVLMIVALYIHELLRGQKAPTHNIAFALTGHVSITVPFSLLTSIGTHNYNYIMAMFILTWLFDSGAYLVGSCIGKHKMIERISPKKSWEGEIGGLVVTLIGAVVLYLLHITPLSFTGWMIFGTLVVIFGTLGDLTESMMKRAASVKDSGSILPGHGGILDRFDSILLISPIIFIYLEIIFELQ